MEKKAQYQFGGISVEIDLVEILSTIERHCKSLGLNPEENTKLKTLGLLLFCEGIRTGTISEHKRMQDALGLAIPLVNKCVDFVELIQKIELGMATPKGKA
jgi:hypothetical protein